MAARITVADLVIVPCACGPCERLPDGTFTEWHETPKAAALAVRRHVEADALYWAVHYHIVDGHLRAEEMGDAEVPVLVLNVTAPEAEKLLATLDPLSALAETDQAALNALTERVQFESAALQELVTQMHVDSQPIPEPHEVALAEPPKIAWLLLGVPMEHVADLHGVAEKFRKDPRVVVEMSLGYTERPA